MLDLARALKPLLKPRDHPEYDPTSWEFVEQGFTLGNMLHRHGHKELPQYMWPGPQDWAAAGQWNRDATGLARRLGVSL
jgi:hypothetical protein